MKNKVLEIHKDFRINGESFVNSNDLLEYIKPVSLAAYAFIKEWFSNDAAIELRTSGSTGVPKKIYLAKGLMVNSAMATGSYFELPAKTTTLICVSVDYIAGKMMLVRAMVLGWHIDIVSPKSNIQLLKNYDFCAMVPLQLRNSLSQLHRIKKLIVGGGVVSDDLLIKIQGIPTLIYATYGMTETITHIAVKKINNCSLFESTYYRILNNVSIYVDDRDCLIIEAPRVSNSIIKTNDVVSLVSDRHFEWLGRFDNVVNSGGVKLFPEVIERKLGEVIESRFFVIGVEDNVLGQKLVLVVEGKQNEISLEKVKLSKYERPKTIYYVDFFIETETKKVQRNKTLKLAMTSL